MPGFGYTVPAQDFVYDREHWGRFVVRLLDVLGIPRAHIVGNSYGAAVAVEVALRAPERAERLVLMGPAVLSFPITEGLEAVWGYRPSMEAMEALLPRFVSNKGMITPELVRSRFEASARPDAAMRYETLFPAPRQDALDRLALEEKEVCEIEHEVLIIHGRDDAVIPLEVSLRAFGLVARGELGVFAPCGHWVQVEQPVRFTSLVTSWLDGDG
jgi:2-hydroxymuconate-semialdehyde hydrolase